VRCRSVDRGNDLPADGDLVRRDVSDHEPDLGANVGLPMSMSANPTLRTATMRALPSDVGTRTLSPALTVPPTMSTQTAVPRPVSSNARFTIARNRGSGVTTGQ
jgi:hypothetical protein